MKKKSAVVIFCIAAFCLALYQVVLRSKNMNVLAQEQTGEVDEKKVELQIPGDAKPGDIIKQKGYTVTMLPDSILETEVIDPKKIILKQSGLPNEVFAQFEKRFLAAQTSLEKNKDNTNAWLELAQLLEVTGNQDTAIEIWLYLTKIQPGLLQSYGNLANAYTRKGEFAKAEEYYKKAIEKNTITTQYHHDLFDLYKSEKKNEEAILILNDGIEQFPEALDLYIVKARFQKDIGDLNGAGVTFAEAILLAKKSKNADAVVQIEQELSALK